MKIDPLPILRAAVVGLFASLIAACASPGGPAKGWTVDELSQSLANPSRPQADRDRDADRKPAQIMTFLGVERGMTAVDILAANGYLTEVLAVAVGPQGKVYSHNPPAVLTRGDGAVDKALKVRMADNRLPNVVRVDADQASSVVAANSVDVAVSAMNFHDVYNRGGAAAGDAFLRDVYTMLKPGGVLGLIDHAGNEGADNATLHRIPVRFAIESAKSVGFVLDTQGDILANPADDHTKGVRDPAVRGKTDQFTLRLRKPQ